MLNKNSRLLCRFFVALFVGASEAQYCCNWPLNNNACNPGGCPTPIYGNQWDCGAQWCPAPPAPAPPPYTGPSFCCRWSFDRSRDCEAKIGYPNQAAWCPAPMYGVQSDCEVGGRWCMGGGPDPSTFPAPIPAPTKHPFPQPTRKPIPAPTKHPFPQPTRKPTPAPTKHPFPEPTRKPIPA
eukprot:CAMPEP_0171728156 /NCGR_PEP_ID=MMETSP0991-20121206/26778_1 /TAXON_ID=483369 /ORGANISM="non described non described, Strain CCMP2098" /LENGTH=180 /DNA_ID=CAMNT_0012322145 /DNA_START=339 /DNA_END=878 /DNA_ORIENTATION=-